MRIPGIVEHIKHQSCLAAHDCKDRFPLDGSDWARLVDMRLHGHHQEVLCDSCAGFWLKLHSKESPLFHERKKYQQGLMHWFSYGNDQYQCPWRYRTEWQEDPLWRVIIDGMSDSTPGPAEVSCTSRVGSWDASHYWICVDREGREGPVSESKRIGVPRR